MLRVLAGLLVLAVVTLPLVFVPGLDDGYALPKALVLRVVGLAGAALFLGYVLSGGSLTRNALPRVDLPLLAFAGLLIASSFASVDPVESFNGEAYQYQGLVTVLVYIGSFYVARLALGSAKGFRAILTATAWAGAVVAVYAVAQGLGFDPFWSGPADLRVISSVGQTNDLAAYLDLVVVAALGLWRAAGRHSRFGLATVVDLAFLALTFTLSRGGVLGLAVALVVLLAPRYRRPERGHVAIGLVVAVAVIAVAVALPATRAIAEHVAHRVVVTVRLRDGSIGRHLDLWEIGGKVALDHPLLGTGPETFPLVSGPYLDRILPPDRAELLRPYRLESPHNELIGIAAEMGLPALAAYLAFIVASAATCIQRARAADDASRDAALVAIAILAVHVVTTFFMTPEVSTSVIFWIALGAGLAAAGRELPVK